MSDSERNNETVSVADSDYMAFHPDPKVPDMVLPSGACDAHCHVFGPAALFPFASSSTYRPVDAPKETLFQRHALLGIERAVIVQASCHGTDNRAMLDALDASNGKYRGVAVVAADIEQAALESMHQSGVRGVRFNFVKRLGGKPPGDMQQRILEKIKCFNWHVVVYFDSEDIDALAPFLDGIDVPVIIDHMGRVPVEAGTSSHSFELLSRLFEQDKYWVKISCPERLSKTGPPYSDVEPVARALLQQAPERILWGTDWPHPNMKSHMPDDGLLVDRIVALCQSTEKDAKDVKAGESLLQQILVENPDRLYWADA